MKVDTDWLFLRFYELNERFFNKALPTPQFDIDYSRTKLGHCYCSYSLLTLAPDPSSYKITISNQYQRGEGDYLNTLLHEMIHLYFFATRRPYEGHGSGFQQMARSFDKYGFDIQTCNEVSTDLHPCISSGGFSAPFSMSPHIGGIMSSFLYYSLWAFVLGMFLCNADAMKVIFFFSKIGICKAWETGCQLWTEYHVTEHLLQLIDLLLRLVTDIFDYASQLVTNIL